MANKLTDLTVEKIAFVDEGDNPEANILFFKKKPQKETEDNEGSAEETIIKRIVNALLKALGTDEKKDIPPEDADDGEKKAETEKDVPKGEKDGKSDIPDEQDIDDEDKKLTNKWKGDYTDMSKIDKSKLTKEELAQLEAIEKKALVEDAGDDPLNKDVEKNKKDDNQNGDNGSEDIYKNLHPEVKAEIERLKKRADEAEERELLDIAKRYEVLGKKPEELSKTLKSLRAAGGTAYDDMLAVLDASVTAVEKSGAFDEIGKRGGTGINDSEKAWAQIENHAKEIRKSKPELTWEQAVDEAAQQHPELVSEYENNM